MKLTEFLVAILICACSSALAATSQNRDVVPSSSKSTADQIADQLNELTVVRQRISPDEVLNIPPDDETQEQVRSKLIEIAGQSSEARSNVIDALINVVDNQSNIEDRVEARLSRRWKIAVEVLGELQAVEAIGVLIKYLDDSGMIVQIHPSTKPAQIALVKIGKPAVLPLIKALGKGDESVSWEAILTTLREIGQIAVPQLIKALSDRDPSIRDGSALALGFVPGQYAKVKKAIKRALKRESDPKVRASLEYALQTFERR